MKFDCSNIFGFGFSVKMARVEESAHFAAVSITSRPHLLKDLD